METKKLKAYRSVVEAATLYTKLFDEATEKSKKENAIGLWGEAVRAIKVLRKEVNALNKEFS